MRKKRVPWEGRQSSSLASFLRAVRTTLEDNGLAKGRFKFSHIPSETISQVERIQKWRLGLEPGVPDFLIAIPKEISLTGVTTPLWIEMKALHGDSGKKGTADQEQNEWLEVLGEVPGSTAKLCIGDQEAMVLFFSMLNLPTLHLLYRMGHTELIEDRRFTWKLLEKLNIVDSSLSSDPRP